MFYGDVVCGDFVICFLLFNSVGGIEALAFQYLFLRFESGNLVHVVHYLFFHIFQVSHGQKTNLTLLSFELG